MKSSLATLWVAVAAGGAGLLAGLALAPLSPWAPQTQPATVAGTKAVDRAAPTAGALPEPGAAEATSGAASPETGEETAPIPRGPLPGPYAALLDSASLDLDADGADEVVELSAAVEEDDRGRRMWDDGQRWMLRVRDAGSGADQGWVLFDGFVQLGRVSFRAVETTEPPPVLVLELSTGAGIQVWSLRYDPGRDAFVEGSSVAAHGNVVHETPADID